MTDSNNTHLHMDHNPKNSPLADIVDNTLSFFEEYLDLENFVSGATHTLPVTYVIKSKIARLEPDTSYQLDEVDDDKDIAIVDEFLTSRDFANFRLLSNGDHFYMVDDTVGDVPRILAANGDNQLVELTDLTTVGDNQDRDIQYFYMAEKAIENK